MNGYIFRAITKADIPAMTNLLLSRQTLEAKTFPFLKNHCLNVNYITDKLERLFGNKVIGIGAFSHQELVGFLIGELKIDSLRGRHVWIPYEGIAIRENQSPELIRFLYTETSVMWLKQGFFMHYAVIPLGFQSYFEALQRLSFFIQQVHGVMSLEEYLPFEEVSDAEIRIAAKEDREKMGRLSGIIQSYQNSAPTFELALPEIAEDIKSGYENIVDDADVTVLIAEKNSKELGFQIYEPAAQSLMWPDGAAELSVAGTYPCQMGRRVGKKIMNEGCRIIRERGYRHIIADWRISNLASSTFWPKCGFHPIAYRMVRIIDSNWAWANISPSGNP